MCGGAPPGGGGEAVRSDVSRRSGSQLAGRGLYNRLPVLVLDTFTVPPFGENTYLVGDDDAGTGIVVDPGGRVDDILRVAEERGVRIAEVVNTHADVDHVLGAAELLHRTGARFLLHPDAAATLGTLPADAARFGLQVPDVPAVDGALAPGDEVAVGGLRFEVRYTPGHAPGHVTLVGRDLPTAEGRRTLALCGDVVFLGSIGRTDLAGGDHDTLMRSIENEILTLPDDCVLLPGHGPATSVGYERTHNPFVREWLTTGSRA